AAEAAALHRDVVAVLDVSGSMSGEKIAQAQAALIQILGTLRAGDRFRLVAFSSGVRRYRAEWTALTPESRRDAESWVRGLEAEGGTNIAGALDEAFSQPPADGAELYDVQPDRLPDLFANDEVVVFGRYRGAGNGERTVTVSGRRAGRTERFSASADFSTEAPQARFIEQLWAARRAGALAQE